MTSFLVKSVVLNLFLTYTKTKSLKKQRVTLSPLDSEVLHPDVAWLPPED